MRNAIFSEELIRQRQVGLVPKLLEESAHKGFVSI
jgi:hypothetical protein